MGLTDFDFIMLLIFLLAITIQGGILYYLLKHKKLKVILTGGILAFLIFQTGIIYGTFIESRLIEVRRHDITFSENGVDALKIVFVSDYHVGPYKKEKFVQRTVEMINEQSPDIVLLGGDFVYGYEGYLKYLEPLKNIDSTYGVYAVLGNHDYGLKVTVSNDIDYKEALIQSEVIKQYLQDVGIHLLLNKQEKISLGDTGQDVIIAGIDEVWSTKDDIEDALRGVGDEDHVILLSHNPDVIRDPKSTKADLILSGHTHGGQIRLPFLGPLTPLPTTIGQKFDHGLFDLEEGNQLYISKGIGETGPRMRFFCKPEIAVFTILL